MTRFQQGYIYEAFNAFHVRYYQTAIIDGKPTRVQKSHKFVEKNTKYHSRACKPVRQKCEDFMRGINEQAPGHVSDVTVADFWEQTYLPFVTEKKRASTVYGYKKLWESNLKNHFGTRTLTEYRTADGYKYLESLTKTLGRNSLSHVRSLASGIFTRAVNLGLIDTNPWSAVRQQESRAPEPTVAYTLTQSVAILKALKASRIDAALVFSLAAFLGMRPSEIAGLKWEDIFDEAIHIRQAVVRGIAGDTKTPQSQRTLPLIEPVRSLMVAYREQCAGISTGWLFTGRTGQPVKMESFIKHAIMPAVRRAELPWYGLYAARRACATNLVALTGDVNAAYQVLGNSLQVTLKNYIKPSLSAGLAGLKLLEAAATNGKE